MGSKNNASSKFWLKQLMIIAAVIAVALAFIVLQDLFAPSHNRVNKDPAAGFSEFYSNYRSEGANRDDSLPSDFVLEVETEEVPLGDRLMEMESQAMPVSEDWEGELRYRTFKAGMTLREALAAHAQEEGMQVIWELPKDFVIKDHFQMEGSILEAVNKVAKAINTNFSGEVRGYFCPAQRSLVLTNQYNSYLRQNCQPTDNN
ncbi:hypothetical protein HMF8227_02394 [Saliniradius amylolyticus]|uniref:Toxin co-regulated pilus biosynthesis protein Q C-terminal domain-containing protein n=1 Tax=Saliniradius amylolyticus TaxID=2183582 RepID=A0A2S2E5B5_9ALTE|nr:toxin co-regulated pilus biosynthesis Q family protein [Saliniradius amylolyticus]AWL12846.1 hypothetical protein HMF8227_02394 [Saliniradius amylolyticus]